MVDRRDDDSIDRADLDRLKSEVKSEVKEMNDAAIRHVERIIAPFTDVPQRLGTIEEHAEAQVGILNELKEESKKAKAARVASRKERLKRAALDEVREQQEAKWRTYRNWILRVLAVLTAAAELYRALHHDK
jgi:hypothetical protein